MESNLDFSLVASFIDKVSAPMRAVADRTDGAVAKFADYNATLRSIGQQKGLVKRLAQQVQGLKAVRVALAQNHAEQLARAAAGTALAQKTIAVNAKVSAQKIVVNTATRSLNQHKTATLLLHDAQTQPCDKVRALGASIKSSVKPSCKLRDEHAAAKTELQAASSALSKSRGEQRKANQTKNEQAKTLKTLTSEQRQLNKAMAANDTATAKAVGQEATLKSKRKNSATATARLRRELKSAGGSTRNLTAEQKRLGEQYSKTANAAKGVALAQAKANKASDNYDKAMQRGANASLIAGGMQRFGGGLLSAFSKPTGAAITFEAQMTDVAKFVHDADDALQNKILRLGADSSLGAGGIAELVAAGGQIGLNQNDSLAFATTSLSPAKGYLQFTNVWL